jgi:hypothetical protein
VQNIADILVGPEGARERRDHWEKTAHALLTGAILHVLYAEEEKTLAHVASFLADPSRSILRTLGIMLATNHKGSDDAPVVHPVVASIARELLNKSENERSGVVSMPMSFLGLYRDPIIAAHFPRTCHACPGSRSKGQTGSWSGRRTCARAWRRSGVPRTTTGRAGGRDNHRYAGIFRCWPTSRWHTPLGLASLPRAGNQLAQLSHP